MINKSIQEGFEIDLYIATLWWVSHFSLMLTKLLISTGMFRLGTISLHYLQIILSHEHELTHLFDSIQWLNVLIVTKLIVFHTEWIKKTNILRILNLCFIPDSILEMPIGIDILISEESPYFSLTLYNFTATRWWS